MHAQPVVEAVEDCVGILQLRLIPFVSPYVQARRIESGKLRPLLQLPDECLEALQLGGPDRYFSAARHGWLSLFCTVSLTGMFRHIGIFSFQQPFGNHDREGSVFQVSQTFPYFVSYGFQ